MLVGHVYRRGAPVFRAVCQGTPGVGDAFVDERELALARRVVGGVANWRRDRERIAERDNHF